MVAQPTQQPMSVEAWRSLLRTSEHRYAYYDGWVYAMAGGTADHARIAINVIRALEDDLGDGPCRVYSSDLAARLSPTKYVFPDVTVTCDPEDRGSRTEILSPRVAVAVLSEGTEQEDRTVKAPLYRACPRMQEYVFIATRFQGVEVYRRAGGIWISELYGPGEIASLASIGARLIVSDLYRRTEVPGPSCAGAPREEVS